MRKFSINKVQEALKVTQTGFLDKFTKAALKNFQLTSGLFPSGIIDDSTLTRLEKRTGIELTEPENIIKSATPTNYIEDKVVIIPNITTDYMELFGKIKDYKLNSGQYINQTNKKKLIFIHHTAGWSNPYAVVDDWNKDTRGAIGTHYVIGGINAKTGDRRHDGEIVKAIDHKNHAYHLGGNLPSNLTTESISIELCSFGQLTEKSGKFYTYVNTEVDKSQVITLSKAFRGFKHWHAYSQAQIDSLIKLIIDIGKSENIDIKKGLPYLLKSKDPWDALELNSALCRDGSSLGGIWSHTNVRLDKVDVYPHPVLMAELKKL